jgi:tyrosinase
MVVTLGPVMPVLPDVNPNPQRDGLGHNPRCLRRDLNKNAAAVTTAQHTFDLITESKTADAFHDRLMGFNGQKDWGVHSGGHFSVGGEPAGVSSPVYGPSAERTRSEASRRSTTFHWRALDKKNEVN